MAKDRAPTYYLDACVFIDLIETPADQEPAKTIVAIIEDAEDGRIKLVTSVITIAEVWHAKAEIDQESPDAEIEKKIARFWHPGSSPIWLVDVHEQVVREAAQLLRQGRRASTAFTLRRRSVKVCRSSGQPKKQCGSGNPSSDSRSARRIVSRKKCRRQRSNYCRISPAAGRGRWTRMSDSAPSPRSEFDNFQNLTRRLLAVPKSEVPKHVPKKRVKPARPKAKK